MSFSTCKVRHFTVCKYTIFFNLLGSGVMLFSLEIRNKGDVWLVREEIAKGGLTILNYHALEKMRGVMFRESQVQRRRPSVEARLSRCIDSVPTMKERPRERATSSFICQAPSSSISWPRVMSMSMSRRRVLIAR